MARKKASAFSSVKWTTLGGGDYLPFTEVGTSVEGIYRGSEIIKIEGRPVDSHKIEMADGAVKGCSGTVLNNLAALPAGTPVRITYTGLKGKGQRRYKNFTIEYPEGTKVKELERSKPRAVKKGRKS